MAGIDISSLKPPSSKAEKARKESAFAFLNKDINLFGSGLSDKKKEEFYAELSVLLTAGVDMKTSLELVSGEQRKDKEKLFFETIKDKVVTGSTLSDAMKDSGKFTLYEFYSIEIGEETGKLNHVLKELAEFYHKRIEQKRQITSVLSYPVFVLVASFGALTFMLNTVVPMFSGMYSRFGADLPWITQQIISLSDSFKNNFLLFVMVLAGMISLAYLNRNKIWFRKYSSNFLLRLPLFGPVMRKIYLARFCQSMTLLLGAKIPLLRAIELIRKMINFYPLETTLVEVEKDILLGSSLHKSLAKFPIYFPKMVTLIRIGEEVNQLEGFFEKISKQYTAEVEHQIGILKSLIEPLMIVFLGLIVGTIVVAMYLPMFQMTNLF